jgi:putative Ca2+/H+ antiporter (TMEM165/GDT1 family)
MAQLIPIFVAVFLAELGDKTQLATLFFAAQKQTSPWLVFTAAAAALVLSTGIAVALGTVAARYLEILPLRLIAGLGFIAIGVWTLVEHFKA